MHTDPPPPPPELDSRRFPGRLVLTVIAFAAIFYLAMTFVLAPRESGDDSPGSGTGTGVTVEAVEQP